MVIGELWRFPGNSSVPYIQVEQPSLLWLALQGSWEATLCPVLFLLTSTLLCLSSQAVQKIIHQVLEKLEESPFQMTNYASKTSGEL